MFVSGHDTGDHPRLWTVELSCRSQLERRCEHLPAQRCLDSCFFGTCDLLGQDVHGRQGPMLPLVKGSGRFLLAISLRWRGMRSGLCPHPPLVLFRS